MKDEVSEPAPIENGVDGVKKSKNVAGESCGRQKVVDNKPQNSPTKRKRKKRQRSDPSVKDIIQIMAENFNKPPSKPNSAPSSQESGIEVDIEHKECTPKVNAFQFMMNARHRSIGGNSPGKEVNASKSPETEKNPQKLTRKKNLQEWADAKGAAKRKRAYEERGEIINNKLEMRAKRLRGMLKLKCNETEAEEEEDEIIAKSRKRCTVIHSDSEDTGELKEISEKENKNRIIKRRRKLSLPKQAEMDEIKLTLTPNTIKTWRFKIKLNLEEHKELIEESIDDSGKSSTTDIQDEALDANKREEAAVKVVSGQLEDVADNVVEDSSVSISLVNKEDENSQPKEETVATDNGSTRVLRARKSRPIIIDEEEAPGEKSKRKPKKLASVFLKSIPKPKVDPKVLEARREFLMSGIPSSLKKEMVKKQSFEEVEYDVFPSISHVQQKSGERFWDLPKVQLPLTDLKFEKFPRENLISGLILKAEEEENQERIIVDKIACYKTVIDEIKTRNPTYPVYTSFKIIYGKSGCKNEQQKPRRGRKKKSAMTKIETTTIATPNQMWTEKYKAGACSDMLGNHRKAAVLKEWLQNWEQSSNEPKRKKADYSSESEFDSRDSCKFRDNTVILSGPIGTGKSMTVHAVCQQLGLSVLEVNASSKRTGKWLLQELHEATQSHQVRKKEVAGFVSVESANERPKICVLLIEDIDLVFDQDEGFSAALSQIIQTSKRPIVLTTSDPSAINIQKFMSQYKVIQFAPIPPPVLSVWLQIVCLVEGIYVSEHSMADLLTHFNGDVRRTLLSLQLWANSGGQYNNKNKSGITQRKPPPMIPAEIAVEDDSSYLSELKLDQVGENIDNLFVHNYEIARDCSVSNLEVVWWNLPNLLNMPDFAKLRLDPTADNGKSSDNAKGPGEKLKLKALTQLYDSFSVIDVIRGRDFHHATLGPKWRARPRDSLDLRENMGGFRDNCLINDVENLLLRGQVAEFNKIDGNCSRFDLNLAVPSAEESKWRSKRILCEEKLEEAFLPASLVQRRSVVLDYLPTLRAIARSEMVRAANNTKRKNRFYHYLRTLNVNCSDSFLALACSIFQVVHY